MTACECCRIADELREQDQLLSVGDHWTLNANVDSGDRPSLVIQSKAHLPSTDALSEGAARELGHLLSVLPDRLRDHSGAARAYVLYLNESVPPHVHMHLVPRFDGEAVADPRALVVAPLPSGVQSDKLGVAESVAEGLEPPEEPSALVGATIRLLTRIERLALYTWLFRVPRLSRLSRTGRAEFYVAMWLALLLLLFTVSAMHQVAALAASVLATYRLVDLVAMHLMTLLQRTRQRLASFQRSFLLALLNLVEVAVIVGIYVRAAGGFPLSQSILYGFDVVTLRAPSSQPGWTLDLISVTGTSVALLVLTGVVSLVVGLISQSYVEVGSRQAK